MTKDQYSIAYRSGFQLTVRFLISRGLPFEAAEETAQAAWSRGWERLSQLRDCSLVFTWANSIALNMYRSLRRHEPRQKELNSFSGSAHMNLAAIDAKTILGRCKSKDRRLLEMYYLHGLQTGEIAQAQGLSETAVRIRLMRARRAAREQSADGTLKTLDAAAA